MQNNKITIIISLYNKEEYIEQTIRNILEQTYTNWKLIIVDDCSTDKSCEIAKKYESDKIQVIRNKQNYGPAQTRNIGLKYADTDYICYQDADDLWDKTKLEKQIDFMEKNNYAFTYTGFKYMKSNGKLKNRNVNIPYELEYKDALKNTRILANSIMFNVKLIDKELLIMPEIHSEDIATWWNILKRGYIAYGLNEPLVYYRQTKRSLSSNKIKSAKNRWNLYRKYEEFSIIKSMYYFIHYAFFAVVKRM